MLSKQFHPGLERMLRRPPTLPSGGARMVEEGEHFIGKSGNIYKRGGMYAPDELANYEQIAKGGVQAAYDTGVAGDAQEAHRFLSDHARPTQGVLFPRSTENADERIAAVNLHPHTVKSNSTTDLYTPEQYDEFYEKGGRALSQALTGSRMPNELLAALGGRANLVWEPGNEGSGFYSPANGSVTIRTIAKPDTSGPGYGVSRNTVLHELGHRADWRAHGVEGTYSRVTAMHSLRNPEPRSEGAADGIEDRYKAQPEPDFRHHSDPDQGYGTGSSSWLNDTDRAVYSASRAHTSATGELVTAETPTALLHKLMSTSPHAVRALRQNGLKEAGAGAYDAYRESRKAGTQLSMLSEVQYTNDKTGETESAGFVPHPTLAGTPAYSRKNAQGEWGKPNEENIRPQRPNETRRYKSLNYDIYDIPEDHKPA